MIFVNAILGWSVIERSTYAELTTRELNIATTNLRACVDFYARVFGFRAIGWYGKHAPVIMPATARADLVVHQRCDAVLSPDPFVRRWAFAVTNLDRVRQSIWDLGVRVKRASGDPDQIHRWSSGRSLYISAPDGNEIELVEVWNCASAIVDALRAPMPGIVDVRSAGRRDRATPRSDSLVF